MSLTEDKVDLGRLEDTDALIESLPEVQKQEFCQQIRQIQAELERFLRDERSLDEIQKINTRIVGFSPKASCLLDKVRECQKKCFLTLNAFLGKRPSHEAIAMLFLLGRHAADKKLKSVHFDPEVLKACLRKAEQIDRKSGFKIYFTPLFERIERGDFSPSVAAAEGASPEQPVEKRVEERRAETGDAAAALVKGWKPDLRLYHNRITAFESRFREEGSGVMQDLEDLEQWPPTEIYKAPQGPTVMFCKKPFLISSSDKNEIRRAMVVFVDCGKEIKPRIIYTSSTHGVIKCLPRIMVNHEGRIKWFDKGDSQNSITIGFDYQLELIERMYRSDSCQLLPHHSDQERRLFTSFVRTTQEPRQDTFFGNVHEQSVIIARTLQDELPLDATILPEYQEFALPEKCHLNDANSTFTPDSDDYLKSRFIAVKNIVHPRYGKCNIWFFESEHPTKAKRYIVFETAMPEGYTPKKGERMPDRGYWIGAIQPSAPQLQGQNTYLAPTHYYPYDELTTPLLEHGEICQWEYIRRFPVITALKKKIEELSSR